MDFLSTIQLSRYLDGGRDNLTYFERINQSKTIVIGAGPSIEDQKIQDYIVNTYDKFNFKSDKSKSSKLVVMVADGATELLLELGIIPDFVITDLDGHYESLVTANKKGSIMIIHAHGDNIEKIRALCRNHNVRSLFAFGSVVTDRFNDKSDIDLLVSFNPMEYGDYADTYFKLAENFEKLFKRQVDLVTEKSLRNPYFIEFVNKTKTLLYEC